MSKRAARDLNDPETAANLLFDLAHDMRSPLLTLLGFAELAQESRDDPAALDRILASIERSALRLNRLVEDLVNLARLQAPPPPVAPRPLYLRRIAGELCREAERGWDMRGVELELEEDDGPDDLTCDERSLRIAATALLRNAVEASPDEGTVVLRVEHGADGRRSLVIENDGTLLEADDQEVLASFFEAFTRGEEMEGQPPGLGLGLTLARRAAETLGAELTLVARASGGARASITMPVTPASPT